MEEIEFFLDDISKDMLENKTTKKSDALQNLICFDKNEQTILLNNYKKEAYNAIFFYQVNPLNMSVRFHQFQMDGLHYLMYYLQKLKRVVFILK